MAKVKKKTKRHGIAIVRKADGEEVKFQTVRLSCDMMGTDLFMRHNLNKEEYTTRWVIDE